MDIFKPSQDEFNKETCAHVLTPLFIAPGHKHYEMRMRCSGVFAWEIIESRNTLMIKGDMGCYVFERGPGMLNWFQKSSNGGINPFYWAEKLIASGDKGVKQFSFSLLVERLKEEVSEFCGQVYATDTHDAFNEAFNLWLHDLSHDCLQTESYWYDFLHSEELGGSWGVYNPDPELAIACEEFTHHFIWNCRAIIKTIEMINA